MRVSLSIWWRTSISNYPHYGSGVPSIPRDQFACSRRGICSNVLSDIGTGRKSSAALATSNESLSAGAEGSHQELTSPPPRHKYYWTTATEIRVRIRKLKQAKDLEKAWQCYEEYKALDPPTSTQTSNHARKAFHRLVILLSRQRPRTRRNHMRLLDVFNSLRLSDAEIHTWEWNVLIHYSGSCYRKTTEEDYQTAVDVYHDMIKYQTQRRQAREQREDAHPSGDQRLLTTSIGDAATFATLLGISLRSGSDRALRHASMLLDHSELPPIAMAELSVLKHFARTGETHAASAVIEHVHRLGLPIAIAGLNHFMWVHASNNSFEIPLGIYRTLRDRVISTPLEDLMQFRHVTDIGSYKIPEDLRPDTTTFTLLIQCLAYHGHFGAAMEIFKDLIHSRSHLTLKTCHPSNESSHDYLLPVYRALFLGFYMHGAVCSRPQAPARSRLNNKLGQDGWNYQNLENVFQMFLHTPHISQPNDRILYWIVMAFHRTTNSMSKVKRVWDLLNSKFKQYQHWRGRMGRLNRNLMSGVNEL